MVYYFFFYSLFLYTVDGILNSLYLFSSSLFVLIFLLTNRPRVETEQNLFWFYQNMLLDVTKKKKKIWRKSWRKPFFHIKEFGATCDAYQRIRCKSKFWCFGLFVLKFVSVAVVYLSCWLMIWFFRYFSFIFFLSTQKRSNSICNFSSVQCLSTHPF